MNAPSKANDVPLKLVVVGQTPPPFNGQAKMIEAMLEGFKGRMDLRFVRMAFSDSVSTAGKWSPGKVVHLFSLIVRTWRSLGLRRNRWLYYPPASPNWIPVLRDILFLLAVRPLCKGLILQFHAGGVSLFAAKHALFRWGLMLAYGRMDLGIVQGASCPDDPGFFKAKRKAVVPYGIDLAVEPRSAPRGAADPLHILYVGIHSEEKGLFVLLDTARDLLRRGVDFELHTVGIWYAEEEANRFEAMKKSYGLDERVCCLGGKTGDDLWAAYRGADVLFFPTKYPWETLGIVQLEAMAHGLPVVASDWQGPRDVVVEGVTGFLCPPNDAEAFAERLEFLAENEQARREMGLAGLKRYESEYTRAHYIERLERALLAL